MSHYHLDRDTFRVSPGSRIELKQHNPADTHGIKDKDDALETLEKLKEDLTDLQYRLWAEDRRSLLVVLQAMDAGGKDGTIRHIFTSVNPQGCRVTSFKQPSAEERDHDFLWRIHRAVPAKGEIGIFNRSHYEDVLVVRVENLVPEEVWSARYEQINAFERHLHANGVTIVKLFLHISRDEQRERFQARLDDSRKNWKFSPTDLKVRERWDDYQRAYEVALSRCSTEWAPWHIVPADHKWFRNLAVASLLVETLKEMDPRFPRPDFDPKSITIS